MARSTYLSGLALVLLAGAFLLTDALTWTPGVTERNARRIRPGMTTAQVGAILGDRGPDMLLDDAAGRRHLFRQGRGGFARVCVGWSSVRVRWGERVERATWTP